MDTSEVRPILQLAGPAVLSALASQGLMVVDTVMVADFGQNAIGGASLALLVCFATLWLARGIQRAMDPLVSQACGAGERDAAGRWLRRGILWGCSWPFRWWPCSWWPNPSFWPCSSPCR